MMPTNLVADAPLMTPPVLAGENVGINMVEISVSIDPGLLLKEVSSPYHEIVVRKEQASYIVNLTDGRAPMNRDFELAWRLPVRKSYRNF